MKAPSFICAFCVGNVEGQMSDTLVVGLAPQERVARIGVKACVKYCISASERHAETRGSGQGMSAEGRAGRVNCGLWGRDASIG